MAQHIPELDEAYVSMNHVTNSLSSFQLNPDGLIGEYLFNYMLKFGTCDPKYSPLSKNHDSVRKPLTWLDVDITDNQVEVVRPKSIGYMLMEAMKDAGDQGETTNLAKQKLDMFGE